MKNLLRLLGLAFALACLNTSAIAQGVGVFTTDPAIVKAFHNQGGFSTTQNYAANDVVSVSGALYYAPTAIAASTTAPPGNGWLPYGGGSASTGAAITSTIGLPAGLQVFGDSISAATGASPFTNGYAFLVSQAYGGPQSVAQTSRSGEQALDGGTFLETGTANGKSDYIVEYGTNDISHYNSNASLQNVFQRSYLHDLLWPAALNTATFAQSCTPAGTGVADNSIYTGLGYELTATGSTLSCTVPATKAADDLYVGFHIFNGWTGTFTVSVDGVAQTDPFSGSTTFVAYGDGSSNFATANTSACYGFGVQCGIVAVRLANAGTGWAAGNHVVLFTATNASATTAVVEPDYAVFAPSSAMAATMPMGVAVTPNPRNDSYASLVTAYVGAITSIEGVVSSDGWPVALANTNAAISTNPACTGGASPPFTNCYSDGVLHPNNTGHGIMAATVEAAVPAAHLTGVQIPNNNQPTDILGVAPMNTPEAYWSPNPYGATIPAGKWQPGVAWFKGSGLVYGTGFVSGYGTTTFGPASGGNIASWCNYQITGYGQYPTPSALQTVCPLQIAGNAANFFLNPAAGTSVLSVQGNTLVVGATNSATLAPTLNWNNYAANTYSQDPRPATSAVNYANGKQWYRANCWNGTAATVDDVSWLNSPGTGASPAMVFKAVLANGCGGTHAIDLSAFSAGATMPPIITSQVNSTYYVGSTIQAAVTLACTATKGRVSIPAAATPSDTVAAVTGGCANVGISDERTTPSTSYTWGSSGPYTAASTTLPAATASTPGVVQYQTGVTPAALGSASTRNLVGTNAGGICPIPSAAGTPGDLIVLDASGQCPSDTGRQPTPLPSAGQVAVGGSGGTGFQPQTVVGDCTMSSTGSMICAKTNGVAFGSAATMPSTAFDAAGAAAAAQTTANAAATPASVAAAIAAVTPASIGADPLGYAGKSAATITIAAANSPSGVFASIQCNGTSDQTCINTAETTYCLNSNTLVSGCDLYIMPGVYKFAGPFHFLYDNVRLHGIGGNMWGGYNNHPWQGNGSPAGAVGLGGPQFQMQAAGTGLNVIDVTPTTPSGTGADTGRLRGLMVEGLYLTCYNFTGSGITSSTNTDHMIVRHNTIQSCNTPISMAADSPEITSNSIQSNAGDSITATGSGNYLWKVHDNLIFDNGGRCFVSNGFQSRFVNNDCGDAYGGVYVTAPTVVADNSFVGIAGDVATFAGALVRGSSFTGNMVDNYTTTNGYNQAALLKSSGHVVTCTAGALGVSVVGGSWTTGIPVTVPAADFTNCPSSSMLGITLSGPWGLTTSPIVGVSAGQIALNPNAFTAGTGPAAITSAALIASYQAATIAQANGSTVTTWADGSGLGNTLTASGAPTYQTASLVNSHPAVRFNTATAYLACAYCYTSQQLTTHTTFVAFAYTTAPTGSNTATLLNPGFNNNAVYINSSNQVCLYSGAVLCSTATMTVGSNYIIEATTNGSSSRISVNGALTTGNAGSNPSTFTEKVGGLGSATTVFAGDMTDVDLYYGPMTQADAASIASALSTSTGITITSGSANW